MAPKPSQTHLQNDVRPRQTAAPAVADFHIVQATVALGDIPDLSEAPTLHLRFPWGHGVVKEEERRMMLEAGG